MHRGVIGRGGADQPATRSPVRPGTGRRAPAPGRFGGPATSGRPAMPGRPARNAGTPGRRPGSAAYARAARTHHRSSCRWPPRLPAAACLAADDPGGGGADIGAVQAQPDALDHPGQVLFAQVGAGVGGAGLGAVAERVNGVGHHGGVGGDGARVGVQQLLGVAHGSSFDDDTATGPRYPDRWRCDLRIQNASYVSTALRSGLSERSHRPALRARAGARNAAGYRRACAGQTPIDAAGARHAIGRRVMTNLQADAITLGIKDLDRARQFCSGGFGSPILNDHGEFIPLRFGHDSSMLAFYSCGALASGAVGWRSG